MEQTTTYDDPSEERAHRLSEMLHTVGVPNEVHWDRSPWGVRIWLTDQDGPEYGTPSLYVLTEGTAPVESRPTDWVWNGSLGGFAEGLDDVLNGINMEFLEFGGPVSVVAPIVSLVKMLKAALRTLEFSCEDLAYNPDELPDQCTSHHVRCQLVTRETIHPPVPLYRYTGTWANLRWFLTDCYGYEAGDPPPELRLA